MPYKPFLSYPHTATSDLRKLRDELAIRGAGAWQDATDLRLGSRWNAAFQRAIGAETGGFILWLTEDALHSTTIRRVEVPSALQRARRRRRGAYPIIPLFVGLNPGADESALQRAFGKRRAARLAGYQGVVRGKRESVANFAARAARRYVEDLIREHDRPELHIAVTGGRAPSGQHDLTLDWRPLLDQDGRLTGPASLDKITDALATIREAAQSSAERASLVVEPHVRLPLGALIGWELHRIRQIDLTVIQPATGSPLAVPDLLGDPNAWQTPAPILHGGAGPAVLAVSVGKDLGDTVLRYSRAQDACESIHLHVDTAAYPGRALPAEAICSLAEWTVARLAELNGRGLPRHLLLLGPVSLAVRVGSASNGTGRTFVPFWDGGDGYVGGITIGT